MRVGIIGLGAIAPMHINALLDCREEIVAFCDVDESRFDAIKREFADEDFSKVAEYTDYIEMLEREKLDSVHICTPHYLHAPMICEALSRNINVLSEKPLAISFEQLDMIEKAVKASSAKLGVSFQNRYNPTVIKLKEFLSDKTVTAGCGNLVWKRDASYYRSGEWRGKMATEGGGVMINQAIHTLDLLQHVCGMPKSLIAHTSNNSLQGVVDVEDTAYGLFKVNENTNFVITATNASKRSFTIDVKLYADGHTVALIGESLLIDGVLSEESNSLPTMGKRVWGLGHLPLVADFYDCVRSGRQFPVDFYEAKKAISLVLKMYESQGREVQI